MYNLDTNGSLIIDPNILALKDFKEVWDKDKSKGKSESFHIFSTLYFLYSPKSPFWNYPDDEKEAEVFKEFGENKDFYKKHKTLIETYNRFIYNNPKIFMLEAAKEGLYILGKRVKDEDSSTKDIIMGLKEMKDSLRNYDSIREEVEKDEINDNTKRGKKRTGNREL